MSEEVDMNVENEEDAGGKVEHVDCSYAFNISQVFVYFVVVLLLSTLNVGGISIEDGNERKRVDLRMNALLEPKLLHPRKTMICCTPASLQA